VIGCSNQRINKRTDVVKKFGIFQRDILDKIEIKRNYS